MRRVEQIMGMPISIEIADCSDDKVFDAAFGRLREIDYRYSTYKPQSEVSRFAAGDLAEKDLSAEFKKVLDACRRSQDETGGYFSAWAGGGFDPSGYVKGWAVAEAGRAIENNGYKTYCIGAGGDILARSRSRHIWHIGIQDPHDSTKILNKLSISNGAVCTSGAYERGRHIFDPHTGRPAGGLASVSVIGPDIVRADILATAIYACGQARPDFLKNFSGYQVLAV